MVGLPGSGAGGVQNGGPGVGVPPVGPGVVGSAHMYPGVGPQDSKCFRLYAKNFDLFIF